MADFYDIDATFSLNAVGDLNILTDQQAIEQSFKNIILSTEGFRPGEGIANVTFGIGIDIYLFTELSQFMGQNMSDNLYRQLVTFEPRAEIENVNVNVNTTDKAYEITLSYRLEGISEELTFRMVVNQI